MKSYKMQCFVNGLRFSCINTIKENKWKLILCFIFILTAISVGVFVAIKTNINCSWGNLQEISLDKFFSGVAGSASAFWQRCFSLCLNLSILVLLAFVPALFPLALVLFAYRAYLFGLNFALIFIFYGIGSIFTAVIIILPCQLAILISMVAFYCILQKMNKNCKRFGGADCNRLLFIVLGVVIVLLINLVETLLLCLLNGKVIMVI